MANPNAPHGLQPVGYTNGAPWIGKANLYHVQSTDTLAYYIGDIMRIVPAGGANSSTVGSDTLGVPNVTGNAAGAIAVFNGQLGPIVGIQVAPIGVGTPGASQNQAVNLNIQYIPAVKLQDYYVWIADDYNLEFEIQSDATVLANATTVGMNAGYTVAAPATVNGPLSGTILTGASLAVTQTLPLKVVRYAYRPNITVFGAFSPLIVRWNSHQYSSPTGTLGT